MLKISARLKIMSIIIDIAYLIFLDPFLLLK